MCKEFPLQICPVLSYREKKYRMYSAVYVIQFKQHTALNASQKGILTRMRYTLE